MASGMSAWRVGYGPPVAGECPNMTTGDYARLVAGAYRSMCEELRPKVVEVDVTGVGAAIYEFLRETGLPVVEWRPEYRKRQDDGCRSCKGLRAHHKFAFPEGRVPGGRVAANGRLYSLSFNCTGIDPLE